MVAGIWKSEERGRFQTGCPKVIVGHLNRIVPKTLVNTSLDIHKEASISYSHGYNHEYAWAEEGKKKREWRINGMWNVRAWRRAEKNNQWRKLDSFEDIKKILWAERSSPKNEPSIMQPQ